VALREPVGEILKEALRSRHEEPFERSLGRAVRKHGGSYANYVELMSRVRERAREDRVNIAEAARRLAAQA